MVEFTLNCMIFNGLNAMKWQEAMIKSLEQIRDSVFPPPSPKKITGEDMCNLCKRTQPHFNRGRLYCVTPEEYRRLLGENV